MVVLVDRGYKDAAPDGAWRGILRSKQNELPGFIMADSRKRV
jgi:hypothetical protein